MAAAAAMRAMPRVAAVRHLPVERALHASRGLTSWAAGSAGGRASGLWRRAAALPSPSSTSSSSSSQLQWAAHNAGCGCRRVGVAGPAQLRRWQSATADRARSSKGRSVLFFGADEFALPSLRALVERDGLGVSRVACVCAPNRSMRRGRRVPQPVAEFAEAAGVDVHRFPLDGAAKERRWEGLPELAAEFDFGVAVSYGQLIPADVVRAFRKGTLNVHPSHLPRHRGAAPIQHTILAGDACTAVSVIELSEKVFDHGDVLHLVDCPVPRRCTFAELRDALAQLGADALARTIEYYDDLSIERTAQNDLCCAEPSEAPKIRRSIGRVRWGEWTSERLDRVFRAVAHQTPVYATLNGKHFHVCGVADPDSVPEHLAAGDEATPGETRFDRRTAALWVRCADDWGGLTSVRFPTKKTLTAEAFANGYGLRKGGVLGDG